MHSQKRGAFFLFSMYGSEVIKYLEEWAPPGAAWKDDNIGLQVGAGDIKIKNILVALELNQKVLSQAIKKNCNFIFTHHPFIFTPLKRLDFQNDPKAAIIQELIKNNITLYSAHTNLDFTKDGVSFELAKKLELRDIKFLANEESDQYKLVVFVPLDDLTAVSEAIFNAGGGIIGEYKKCSYQLLGEGTFEGSDNTNPHIGKKNNFETVVEVRLEVLVHSWKLNSVVRAMLSAHPYEEPAYDIYVLNNKNANYGYGAIGNLGSPMKVNEFLSHVRSKLDVEAVRFTPGSSGRIKKVAVCGGSGSDLVNNAIASGADAYITADIKYHTFQDAENKILLIDAGHYETEVQVLNIVKKKLIDLTKNMNVKVFKYSGSTNPVKFFNN
ncbi:GTP cyclohydrolase 1 type 2 homolog YbgI [hydrothermal vent metagenome]|uniref:GTP cyclohydrolase 1 type 2 homolog YbgI n=2 Tax=hydrothermal vent metagenome TaxID=652676 RepID=A0A3B1DCH8_9ZZZZ